MIKKHKSFLIFFAVIFLLFLSINFSSALEVEDYPNLPGVSAPTANCNPTECLPNYISYFFGLGIYLAGVLAVISLAIGGIRLMTSAGNPGAVGDARERIIGAILGLVLTVSSIIILKTINPVLTTPTLTPLVAGAGIFYTNGSEEKPAPSAEPDTSSIPVGFETIIYKCSESGEGTGPVLLVWKFPEKNFSGYKTAFIERLNCGEETGVDIPSFKISFETPGVYYFLEAGCRGFMSQANLSNTQEIEEPFKSEMKSVQIINDIKNNINYGVVLHKEINFRGDCSVALEAYQKERNCHWVPSPMSSANIFVFNQDKPETSGNGVVFYSKPFGYKTGANAGYYFIKPFNKSGETGEEIKEVWWDKPNKIDFSNSYNYVNVPEEEKNLCKNFGDCPGSIKVQGNYLVILYALQLQSKYLYCQVFDKDVPNLKEEEVTAVQGRKLDSIYIIPVK